MKYSKEERLEKLKQAIQDGISEYVYETGDGDFTALVEVQAVSGWSEKPEIKKYVHFEE